MFVHHSFLAHWSLHLDGAATQPGQSDFGGQVSWCGMASVMIRVYNIYIYIIYNIYIYYIYIIYYIIYYIYISKALQLFKIHDHLIPSYHLFSTRIGSMGFSRLKLSGFAMIQIILFYKFPRKGQLLWRWCLGWPCLSDHAYIEKKT